MPAKIAPVADYSLQIENNSNHSATYSLYMAKPDVSNATAVFPVISEQKSCISGTNADIFVRESLFIICGTSKNTALAGGVPVEVSQSRELSLTATNVSVTVKDGEAQFGQLIPTQSATMNPATSVVIQTDTFNLDPNRECLSLI